MTESKSLICNILQVNSCESIFCGDHGYISDEQVFCFDRFEHFRAEKMKMSIRLTGLFSIAYM